MITVVTYFWGRKYGHEYVHRLAAGVRRHLKQPHRFAVITDDLDAAPALHTLWPIPEKDRSLLAIPGCFARLRLFDPAYQAEQMIAAGERIVCLDLDLIVTGALDPLFDRHESFAILQGANAANPCPYNGSVWMLRAGHHADVWSDFSLEAAALAPRHEFADDQGWFWHRMPNAAGWKVGRESGIFAFRKPGWPGSDMLPASARVVAFPGHRDPAQFQNLTWVRQHWVMRAARVGASE